MERHALTYQSKSLGQPFKLATDLASQIYNSAKYFPGSAGILQRRKIVPCDDRAIPLL